MTNLRYRSEAAAPSRAVVRPDGTAACTSIDSDRLLHELQVHQVELALQNEQLADTRDELAAALERSEQDVQRERATRARMQRVQDILELCNRAARIGHWDHDVSGGLMEWSPVTREILAAAPDVPATLEALLAACATVADRARLQLAIDGAVARGESFDLDLQLRTGTASRLHGRMIGVPIMLAGRCERLYGTLQDIEAHSQALEARLALARAEEANRAKMEFLSRVSHELRTPLNAVIGFSQLLELDPVLQSSRLAPGQVQHVREAGSHLLALINDMLDLTNIESGRLRIELHAVDVARLVDDVAALLVPVALRQRIMLRVSAPPYPVRVLADPTRLRQALANLLANAVKFSGADRSVEVRVAELAGRIEVSVQDHGVGMTEAQLAHLFEPFNRLGAEQAGIEGTGLGLVITRQLVQAMGGTISVTSQPGEGTCFVLGLRPGSQEQPALAVA